MTTVKEFLTEVVFKSKEETSRAPRLMRYAEGHEELVDKAHKATIAAFTASRAAHRTDAEHGYGHTSKRAHKRAELAHDAAADAHRAVMRHDKEGFKSPKTDNGYAPHRHAVKMHEGQSDSHNEAAEAG